MTDVEPSRSGDEPARARLDRVERELAVRRLIDHYSHGCDADDAELVVSLFGSEGRVVVRGVSRSGQELRDFYVGHLSMPTLHFTTGMTMSERTDGLLDVTCGLLALEMPEGETTLVAGRYRDVVEVIDGAARFVEREIEIATRRSVADHDG